MEFSGFLSRLAYVTNPQSVSHRQPLTTNKGLRLLIVIKQVTYIGLFLLGRVLE